LANFHSNPRCLTETRQSATRWRATTCTLLQSTVVITNSSPPRITMATKTCVQTGTRSAAAVLFCCAGRCCAEFLANAASCRAGRRSRPRNDESRRNHQLPSRGRSTEAATAARTPSARRVRCPAMRSASRRQALHAPRVHEESEGQLGQVQRARRRQPLHAPRVHEECPVQLGQVQRARRRQAKGATLVCCALPLLLQREWSTALAGC
jgi:hypothetical protein